MKTRLEGLNVTHDSSRPNPRLGPHLLASCTPHGALFGLVIEATQGEVFVRLLHPSSCLAFFLHPSNSLSDAFYAMAYAASNMPPLRMALYILLVSARGCPSSCLNPSTTDARLYHSFYFL